MGTLLVPALQLFVRRELVTRRTLVLTLLCIVPAAIALTARAFGTGGLTFFERTAAVIYLMTITAVISVFHAVAAFHEEFEERTIVYLLTRPPTRATYVLAKFLAAWLSSAASVAIGIAATAAVCAVAARTAGTGVAVLELAAKLIAVATLATGVYTSLFLLFGLWLKNPVIFGLLFTFGWEHLVALLPGNLRFWTLGLYPRALYIHWAEADPEVFGYADAGAPAAPPIGPPSLARLARAVSPGFELPSLGWSLAAMVGTAALLLAVAVWVFRNREDA
jgi:ABC-2 type transport system permease protein